MIGSLANRSASDGIDVFPNLGYKKDAFLEPSLVSNNFPSYPTNQLPPFVRFTAIYTLFQHFSSTNGYAIDDLSTSVNCPIMSYAHMPPFAHDVYKSNTWKATIIKIPIQQES